jgi:membrane protein implicated in regulation of membrane protease activity
LLPFAASAFLASLLGFYDVAIELQWAMFAIGGAALWVGFYRWARRFLDDHELPPGVGAERLVGMAGVVTVAIASDDTDRRGRVSVAGESWGAIAPTGVALVKGARVRITAMKGTRVVVEPIVADDTTTEEDQP